MLNNNKLAAQFEIPKPVHQTQHQKKSLAYIIALGLEHYGFNETPTTIENYLSYDKDSQCFLLDEFCLPQIQLTHQTLTKDNLLAFNTLVIIDDKDLGFGIIFPQSTHQDSTIIYWSNGSASAKKHHNLLDINCYLLKKQVLHDIKKSVTYAPTNRIFNYLKGGLFNIILASILMHIFVMVVPFYTSIYFNTIVPNEAWFTMIALSFGALLAVGFTAILKEARSIIGQWYSKRIDNLSTQNSIDYIVKYHKYFANQIDLGKTWIEMPSTMQQAMNRASAIVVLPLIDLYASILYLIIIYLIAGYLVVVPIIIGLIIILVAQRFANKFIKLEDEALKVNKDKNALMVEYVRSIYQIQLFPTPPLFVNQLKQSFLEFHEKNNILSRVSSSFGNFIQSITQIQTLLLLFVGLVGMTSHELTVGGVFATLLLTGRLSSNFGAVFGLLLQKHRQSQAESLLSDLDTQIQKINHKPIKKMTMLRYKGHLNLEKVCFSYGQNSIIRHLDLCLKPNELVVIYGNNGCGKTTLLHLIAGLLNPDSGTLFYDDLKHTQLSQYYLANHVSLALQHASILSGTIEDNFFWQKDKKSLEIRLKKLAFFDFILNSSLGLNAEVNTDGSDLSSGQRQIISLARALVRSPDAKLLLLDEPLAALDGEQQLHLINYLQTLRTKMTIIIVSNDRPLLSIADRILKLENGVLIKESHSE